MTIIKKHPLLKREVKCGGIMGINRVGILGAGTMGEGIAQVVAQAGFQVAILFIPFLFCMRLMGKDSLSPCSLRDCLRQGDWV